jgi:hypothetical protein
MRPIFLCSVTTSKFRTLYWAALILFPPHKFCINYAIITKIWEINEHNICCSLLWCNIYTSSLKSGQLIYKLKWGSGTEWAHTQTIMMILSKHAWFPWERNADWNDNGKNWKQKTKVHTIVHCNEFHNLYIFLNIIPRRLRLYNA